MTGAPGPATPDFFGRDMAASYDARNARLAPISDALHFLVELVLADLPPRARVLCVGVGTGAEILALAGSHPDWSFVGVDPSAGMLAVCRERLARAGVLERCELVQGHVGDAPKGPAFDAGLSLLVAHFVGREDRSGFYRGIHERLKPGGRFVSAEICCDLDGAGFSALVKDWERVQALMGAGPDALRSLPETLRDVLSILSPTETEALIEDAGFDPPVPFCQAFLIRGVHAQRPAVAGRSEG